MNHLTSLIRHNMKTENELNPDNWKDHVTLDSVSTKAQHTQGDWVRKEGVITNPNYDHQKGNIDTIAKCFCGFDVENTEAEAIANAKLIQAAPKLLEALHMFVNEYRVHYPTLVLSGLDKKFEFAIEAIKQATE